WYVSFKRDSASRRIAHPGSTDLQRERLLPGGRRGSDRLLLLVICNGSSVELVQLDDARPTAHQGRHGEPSLCLTFRLNDDPSAVDASFASPVKIPEIALRVDQLDQIEAFGFGVWRLDQVAIHAFLLGERVMLRSSQLR